MKAVSQSSAYNVNHLLYPPCRKLDITYKITRQVLGLANSYQCVSVCVRIKQIRSLFYHDMLAGEGVQRE